MATKTTSNRPDGFPMWVSDVEMDWGPSACPGLREVRTRTITTDYASYGSAGPWAKLPEADRHWWRDVLSDFHAARLQVAELPYEQRQRVEEAIADEDCDLSDWPGIVRRAIAIDRAREFIQRARSLGGNAADAYHDEFDGEAPDPESIGDWDSSACTMALAELRDAGLDPGDDELCAACLAAWREGFWGHPDPAPIG
jgi:hypothetical protein